MVKFITIFTISLIFGFLVLFFRNYYESKTGDIKSNWNTIQLEEGDSKNFFDRGLALSQGKSYSYGAEIAPIVAYTRTPVYSIFLAFSFLIFGTSLKAIIVLQIIIASLIVCMISIISELVFNSDHISWISGILAIFYYPMWNNAMIIDCELIATLIGLLALYYILKFYYSKDSIFKNLLLSGTFIGLAALTRGQFFYYSFIFLIFIFSVSNISANIKIKYALFWFSFVLIPVLLWSVYAYISSGVFIFISSQGAFSVWWGWSPAVVLQEKYPMWNTLWDGDKDVQSDDLHALYISTKSSFWFLKEAVKFIFTYPVDSLKIAYYKLLECWGLQDFYANSSIVTKIFKALKYNWDFLLAIFGWIILWKQKVNKVFCLYAFFAFVLYILISLMTAGLVRYRIPYLDPLFVILAAVAVFKIYSLFILKKSKFTTV
jgi:hypothetical protein